MNTRSTQMIDYARKYFSTILSEDLTSPDVSVSLEWKNGWPRILHRGLPENLTSQLPDNLGVIGLRIGTRPEPNNHVALKYRHDPIRSLLRLAIRRKDNAGVYESLLYPAVMYPFWMSMNRLLGAIPISASAIDIRGRGMLIAGQSNTGKSTLALSLVNFTKDARLLSDNVVLLSSTAVVAFPEPIRLDPASVGITGIESIAQSISGLVNEDPSFKLNSEKLTAKTAVSIVIFPEFSDTTAVRQIDREEAGQILRTIQLSAHEITGYASYLTMLFPSDSRKFNQDDLGEYFDDDVTFFILSLSKSVPIKNAIELVAGLANANPRSLQK